MTTKEKLLELFENNKGKYFSGEELADSLGISRTSIWKAVKSLQDMGYAIDAVPNKGYMLSSDTDLLSISGIMKYISPKYKDWLKLSVFKEIDSTNTRVRVQAMDGAPEGTSYVAACQTAGRGRFGRSFYSPTDTGVYLSLLLRPAHWTQTQAARITTMAAVSVVEAIKDVTGKDAGIKWVNDIFMDGHKVCGILTEASFDMESGYVEYAIPGIGFNVYTPEGGFPTDLSDIAGSILSEPMADGKNKIAASFINHFLYYYNQQDYTEYVEKYRKYSLVMSKNVSVLSGDTITQAKVLDIDSDCHLIVEYEDGTTDCLSSGEIRIKML